MLFLQGTRDSLADLTLLRPVVEPMAHATMHVVEDADHGFHVRKTSGRTDAQVLDELAALTAAWMVQAVR
jgi:pimeloyl-ACP methyl ester carboxylesterase